MSGVVQKAVIGMCTVLIFWGGFPYQGGIALAGQEGQKIYVADCLSCHGAYGDGKGPKGRHLTPPPPDFTDPSYWKNKTDSYLVHVVQNGMGPMPGWVDTLSPDSIEEVLSYIRSFRR